MENVKEAGIIERIIVMIPNLPKHKQYEILGYGEGMTDRNEDSKVTENN